MQSRRLPEWLFVALAAALLSMTLLWQIPMMLWDHLNLVPMLEALRQGRLLQSAFPRFDGGHIHTAAYAVLLVAAKVSSGRPWLADTVSWLLLLASAGIILYFIRATFSFNNRARVAMASAMVFLALYPGHLANLQWGWQVAVFLCLLGAITVIWSLTRPRLTAWHDFIALAGAALACTSFATGLAVFPVALLLIAIRHDVSIRRRLFFAAPWVLACAGIALVYRRFATPAEAHDVWGELHYLLNFIGAGIARLTTDVAPWLALVGIGLAAWAAWRNRREPTCLPWIGLAAFGLLSGVLVALGRGPELGPEQAFASRYVSFSILFWLGLFGMLCCIHVSEPSRRLRVAMIVIAVFAFGNALQLSSRARHISIRTRVTAQTIRDTWPHVDRGLLGKIYFNQPQVAYHRLKLLHAWGYAPFDRAPDIPTDKPNGAKPGN